MVEISKVSNRGFQSYDFTLATHVPVLKTFLFHQIRYAQQLLLQRKKHTVRTSLDSRTI
jgi:hypothetical protein